MLYDDLLSPHMYELYYMYIRTTIPETPFCSFFSRKKGLKLVLRKIGKMPGESLDMESP